MLRNSPARVITNERHINAAKNFMTHSLPSLQLIDKYLAGESTLEEMVELQRVLELSDGQTLIDALRSMDRDSLSQHTNASARWMCVKGRLLDEQKISGDISGQISTRMERGAIALSRFRSTSFGDRVADALPGHRRFSTRARWAVGAAAAVFVTTMVSVFMLSAPSMTPPNAIVRQFVSPKGEQRTVLLSDGSKAILAPDSRLRVEMAGTDVRDVTLEGAAYFVVQSQSTIPFVVKAGDGVVRVLGTEFSVRHYPSDTAVQVAVAKGRVALRANTNPDNVNVVLAANDVAQLGPGTTVTVQRETSLDAYLGWMDGRVVFRNARASDVLVELERMYNLKFRVADSTVTQHLVNAAFHRASSEEILEVLSLLLQADIHRDGGVMVLSSRGLGDKR